jgi:ribosomal protein L39E
MAAVAASRRGPATWIVARGERWVGKADVRREWRIIDEPYPEGMAEHTHNMFAKVRNRCEKTYGNA